MKELRKYLIITFAIAWVMQFFAMAAFAQEDSGLYQALLMVMMYVPFLAVYFCEKGYAGLGWKPNFTGKAIYFFIAWLAPGILAILGATLYFVIMPQAFDNTGKYALASLGEDIAAQMEAQGMSLSQYGLVTVVSSFTYAPFLNMFFALGEEVGWRGYMYPVLKEKFGVNKGRILGGFIWGVWHWPIMTIGYEYGINYPGYPILGPVLFCVFTISAGILLDWLYEKTKIIWAPALCHGAINAANFALMYMDPDYADLMILGPVQIGIISVIPMVIVALIISLKSKKRLQND